MLNEFNVKNINGEGVSLLTVRCQRYSECFYISSFFFLLIISHLFTCRKTVNSTSWIIKLLQNLIHFLWWLTWQMKLSNGTREKNEHKKQIFNEIHKIQNWNAWPHFKQGYHIFHRFRGFYALQLRRIKNVQHFSLFCVLCFSFWCFRRKHYFLNVKC